MHYSELEVAATERSQKGGKLAFRRISVVYALSWRTNKNLITLPFCVACVRACACERPRRLRENLPSQSDSRKGHFQRVQDTSLEALFCLLI